VRGAAYGIAAIVVLAGAMPLVTDHHDREMFLSVVAGLSAVLAGVGIVVGAFFRAVCSGDIRRRRDWRTLAGRADAVTIMAPALVRTGVLTLVLFPGALGLYHVVDAVAYGIRSWGCGSSQEPA
jgi:hypothetical protein